MISFCGSICIAKINIHNGAILWSWPCDLLNQGMRPHHPISPHSYLSIEVSAPISAHVYSNRAKADSDDVFTLQS